MLNIKRIYDNPADDDGYRILVDRIWPRGVSKERAKLDRWAKTEVTPTTDLSTCETKLANSFCRLSAGIGMLSFANSLFGILLIDFAEPCASD